jgi:hypothetical protein
VLTGWTALHHSASLASHTTTDLLLVCGADRLAKDKEVSTSNHPLHLRIDLLRTILS